MKNFFYFFLTAALVLVASSCKGEKLDPEKKQSDELQEISFKTKGLDVDVSTKAVADVTSLSSFYVSASTGTMGSSDVYKWTGVTFNLSNNVYTGGKYWPETNPNYHFYASNASMTCNNNSAPTISVNGISSDIVCAVCASPAHKETNPLTFDHIFAKLGSVSVNGPGNGYSMSSVSIKITPKDKGTYNLNSGNGKTDATGWSSTGSTSSSAVEIASSDGSKKSNGIYLLPGSYTLTATYTLSKGDFSKSYSKTKDVSLVKGKINNITASIPVPGSGEGAQDISFTITITAWTDNAVTVQF